MSLYLTLSIMTNSFVPSYKQLIFSRSSLCSTDLVPPEENHITEVTNVSAKPPHNMHLGRKTSAK